jgi:STE24 endopeptidase
MPMLPPEALSHFDPAFLERVRAFHDARYLLVALRWVAVLGAAGALALAAGPRWREAARARTGNRPWLARAAFVGIVLVVLGAVRLPISVVSFLHLRAFGLRHDALPSFLLDWGRSWILGLVIVLAVGLPLLALFARYPRSWVPRGLGVVAVLVSLYALAAPVVIDPLFHRVEPLAEGPLRASVLELAERAGLPAAGVYVSDASRRSRAVNAYVTGYGPTRRIVLYDTLVEGFTEAEILTVVAHEIGHARDHHVPLGTALGVGGAGLALLLFEAVLGRLARRPRYEGRGDPLLVFPAYALWLALYLVALPVGNAVSRAFERSADRTALALTGDPDTFIANRVRIAEENLGDVDPPAAAYWILFTHPSTRERIAFAEAWR